MNKFGILAISLLFLFKNHCKAQNISGIVNNYAIVSSISGTSLTVPSALAFHPGDRVLLIQMKGATVDVTNTSSFGNITSLGNAGNFEVLTVSVVSGNTITVTGPSLNTYNVSTGIVQLVRIAKFCMPTVTGLLTCTAWNKATGGGVIAIDAGTLTLNADIDASGKGFRGGAFAVSSFTCDNGNFVGTSGANGGGGQKGESISPYLAGMDGMKGKQANGGGGANSGNSGGGGGANFGIGGFGGNQYSGCDTSFDERGRGGISLNASLSGLFMGGGGGGGFQDNGLTCSPGGNGGGIIYIRANAIIANNHSIMANGANVTIMADAEGAGGGGAGGTIFLQCGAVTGPLAVKTDGGAGGSNNNSTFVTACHGTGGGGGGGVFAFSGASLPGGVTYSSLGGLPGTVNNTTSACYGTTYGATAGANGTLVPGLSSTPQVLSPIGLSVTSSPTICSGESVSLTASGANYYSWSNSSTNATIVVSPTITTSYTVNGFSMAGNACQEVLVTTVPVSACTGISRLYADGALKIYPNPTSGQLFVETTTALTLTLYDESGRKVLERSFTEGEHHLDISACAPGMYVMKATDNTGIHISKLVKTN